MADRQEKGIPLKAALADELLKIADEFDLEFPLKKQKGSSNDPSG